MDDTKDHWYLGKMICDKQYANWLLMSSYAFAVSTPQLEQISISWKEETKQNPG